MRARRRAGAGRRRHLRRVRGKIGMVFQQFNLFPHMTALENCIEAPIHVLGLQQGRGRERARASCSTWSGWPRRRPLSEPALRRPAAARRDRPGAGHAPEGDAVRRGHVGARSGARGRGAGHHPQARRRARPHHADGHPPDGLRQASSPTGSASSTAAASPSRGRPSSCSAQPRNERTRQFLRAVLEAG